MKSLTREALPVPSGSGRRSSYDIWMRSLYLTRSRARGLYFCVNCGGRIARGATYFRNDPPPFASWRRGEQSSQWCRGCILSSLPEAETLAGRFVVPGVRVLRDETAVGVQPVCVELLPFPAELLDQLVSDPHLLHELTPEQFEHFTCERLYAMGFEPRLVGRTNQDDGGIDIIFWSRMISSFPVLGAAQVKHRRDPDRLVQPATVRDFAGALAAHPFTAGLLVTNTSFSPSAEWFAREHARLMRLRGFTDIRRWLAGNFTDETEWRELPKTIEVAPGVIVPITRSRAG